MIFITAKFKVKPEHADNWSEISREFTQACQTEEGCLWFFWSRTVEDPTEYVLVEAFKDPDAGGAHVKSAHFEQATKDLPQYLQETPKIISQEVEGTDWNELGELAVE